jgi:hypothetical protein
MLVCTLGFQMPIGFVALSAGLLLALVNIKEHRTFIDGISWSTVLLVAGMITYVSLLQHVGVIDTLAKQSFLAESRSGKQSDHDVEHPGWPMRGSRAVGQVRKTFRAPAVRGRRHNCSLVARSGPRRLDRPAGSSAPSGCPVICYPHSRLTRIKLAVHPLLDTSTQCGICSISHQLTRVSNAH